MTTILDSFNFGAATVPDHNDVNRYTLGIEWESDLDGVVTGNSWLCPITAPTEQCRMALFRVSDGALIAFSDLFTPTTGAYNEVAFLAAVAVKAGTRYLSGVVTKRYAYTSGGWPYTSTEGHLSAPTGVNGRFKTTTGDPVYPDGVTAANYHISPLVEYFDTDRIDYGVPEHLDQSDGGAVYVLASEWEADLDCDAIGNTWRCPTNGPGGQQKMLLYRASDQQLLGSSLLFTAQTGGYNDILFTEAVPIVAGTRYVSAVITNRYAYTSPGGWPHTSVEGHLTAPAGASVNGRFKGTSGTTAVFPDEFTAASYHIGPIVRLPDSEGPAEVTLTAAQTTLTAPAADAVPGQITVNLNPAATTLTAVPVDATPGVINIDLLPSLGELAAQPLTPVPGQVAVGLTPAETTITAGAIAPETEEGPIIMAASPQTVTLTANTVATLTFDVDFTEVEIENVTGDAVAYYRFDGVTPVIAAAGCHVLRAEKRTVLRKPKTAGVTVVKVISAGTPTIHVRGIPAGY